MGGQDFLADGLLGQRQPELAGLKGHILIVVLGPLQHVLGGAGGRLRPHAAREAPPPTSCLAACTWAGLSHAHLDNAVHMGDEPVYPHFQQHHQGTAHVLAHLGVIIHSQSKQVLQRRCGQLRHGAGG